MLTIFSIPKSFGGDTGTRQRLAVSSWSTLATRIILLGDEPGVAVTAKTLNVDHRSDIARNVHGTPRLDSAFAQVDQLVPSGIRCFVNSDIILTDDLLPAIESVRSFPQFLLVGQSRDLVVEEGELADMTRLRHRAVREGRLRGPAAIDWFVFPDRLFDPLPPFLIGRAAFDNWMIWKARQLAPVIDATRAVIAIHQPHDYEHLSGGKNEAYYGPEAKHNLELAGGKRRLYTLHDASHRMDADLSIHRNLGSIMRARETARKIGWKLGVR